MILRHNLPIILVCFGAFFMAASIFESIKTSKDIPVELHRKWNILTWLMYFFLGGYILFIAIQVMKLPFPLELVTGCVFLGGSLFVLLIIRLTRTTVIKIQKADKEKKEIAIQLLQSQKMESVGRLAGGIAHDFNNLLSVILGYSELALVKISPDDPLKANFDAINDAGQKASDLVKRLLAFSRKQVLEMKVITPNTVIQNMSDMLTRLIGEDIILEWNLHPSTSNITADQGQLEQVLMNLVINSRDAMPCGGKIFIKTSDTILNQEYTRHHAGLEPGPYVMMTITDTGEGMSKEICDHIFEPFFSTKEMKKGTGLGLATVYGIIKQHNGHINVYSEVDRGTTFRVYFPATSEKHTAQKQETEKVHAAAPGSGSILVVDDEASIRKLILDTLQPLGYHCLEASCGTDALELVKDSRQDITLLLTDIIMPGMNGKELSEVLLQKYPMVKTIFMSGYPVEVMADRKLLDSQDDFLQKPVTTVQLTNKINHVMQQ